jgi:hypothetical protein
MAILTPAQLQTSNAATYTTNGVGGITGATARNFNIDFISSSIVASMTSSMTVGNAINATNSTFATSASFARTASFYAGTVTTASYANTSTSASYALNATTASYVSGAILNLTDTFTSTPKIESIITLTAAEYSGIGSPSANILYVII